MLTPDDTTQITGPLEQSASVINGQDIFGEQRQQKQTTDVLAALNDTTAETADVRSPHRQVMRLRQENRRLHLEVEALRQESLGREEGLQHEHHGNFSLEPCG